MFRETESETCVVIYPIDQPQCPIASNLSFKQLLNTSIDRDRMMVEDSWRYEYNFTEVHGEECTTRDFAEERGSHCVRLHL